MPEILPGVHQIAVDYKGRPLKLYLLIGDQAAMLMDTGDAAIPEKNILPYFESIGFDPAARLTYIMITHPDLDHQGGLLRMKQAASAAKVFCGRADRSQIEDPAVLIEQRSRLYYTTDGLGPDDAAVAGMMPRLGGYVPADVTFIGGEEIRLSRRWVVQVLHLPGHSHGHLGVYLPEHKTAIVADAVHGAANAYLDGRPAFAPTYIHINEYLNTIKQLGMLGLERLYSCHWPDYVTSAQVGVFLQLSHEYAMDTEAAILETVKGFGYQGGTLREIILTSKSALGSWPAERDMDARYMVGGHLERLMQRGLVKVVDGKPRRFAMR